MLTPGFKLGSYEVVSSLGAGGMGEVYRARDTKLGRDVALKILPDLFASDVERLARFAREARVLASLNHPHIASIYGIEDTTSIAALVLEFVDGPTLADRIAQGPIPLDDALAIARQIAEALEAAHAQGIIHRDLKPANVKVRDDDTVKVLDFGLAKALTDEGKGADPAMSPTITGATRPGVILGTAAYMAPEQARGKTVDKRADIWAFGCVLYEMLTARRPFPGDDLTEVLAKVIEREPVWAALPESTPTWMRRLLGRCLEKDPRRRLRDVGDALLEIDAAGSEPLSVITTARTSSDPTRLHRRSLTMITGGFVLGAVLSGVGAWALLQPDRPTPQALRRLQVPVSDRRLDDVQVISPDGSKIAYTAAGRLWIRDLGQTTAHDVPNTAGAESPFWSPDGQFLGYRLGGALWRIRAQGGDIAKLCDLPFEGVVSATWGSRDIVIGIRSGWSIGELLRIPVTGGSPESLIKPNRANGELRLSSPHFLPDGLSLLFVALRDNGLSEVMMQKGDTRAAITRARGDLLSVVYSPTGHILYLQAAAAGEPDLWAVPFRADSTNQAGEPIRVASGVAAPSVALDGTLVYAALAPNPLRLALVNRKGVLVRDLGTTSPNARPAVSPDGTRIVHGKIERENLDQWVVDASGRGVVQRLTFDQADEHSAAWLPSGDQIVFVRSGSAHDIFITRTDGSGNEKPIAPTPLGEWAPDVSRDGRYLSYYAVDSKTGRDLWYLPLVNNPTPVPFLQTSFDEALPAISPDGHLLAYQSNESGEWEVYVKLFPTGEGRWQASVRGGRFPRWNPRGGELFYLVENRVMVVEMKTAPKFSTGEPRVVFNTDQLGTLLIPSHDPLQRRYDVMPDGQQFVLLIGAGYGTSEITLIENWAAATR